MGSMAEDALSRTQPLMRSMAEDEDVGEHRLNGKLYDALMREDENEVIDLCREAPENALHILTIHKDTVLHMAAYSKQKRLVSKLLDDLPDSHLDKMTRQNDVGNTILHEVATTNEESVAFKVLRKAPGLLGVPNHLGETALFRAAHYGKTEMFDFLDKRLRFEHNQAGRQPFLQRSDKTTILHISILSQHFDLALKIAKKYKYLIRETDGDGMTGLQLLSRNPSAFKSESEDAFLKRLINSIKLCCSSARQEACQIEKEKQRYVSALELAKFLIERDTSWKATYPGINQSKPKPNPKLHECGVCSTALSNEKGAEEGPSTGSPDQAGEERETPLFLATKSGCVEIVKEILKLYPQAVEHIDDKGRNILHVAIKYRQDKIFKLVKKMKLPMMRLVRKVDNKGNSILHRVGKKSKDYVPEKMQAVPATKLQEELLWFERVKQVTPIDFINHRNHMNQTAYELFAITNSKLYNLAKEWLKRTAEGCSIVAVLIATITFAAAYTIPGGPNQNTGLPVLLYQPFFVVFTVTDVLSLTLALKALLTFLSILKSPLQMEDFKESLRKMHNQGLALLCLSVLMMMVAFAATIILMIHKEERWIKITLYAAAFLPVGIVGRSHFSLYSKTCKYLLEKVMSAFFWSSQILLKIANSCNYDKAQTNLRSRSTNSACPATPRPTTSFSV